MAQSSCSRFLSVATLPRAERWLIFLFVFFLALVATYQGSYTLFLEIAADTEAHMQVFWAEPGRGYGEDNVATLSIRQGQGEYRVEFGGLSPVAILRIDPLDRAGTVCFKRLVLEHPLYVSQIFQSAEQFSVWRMQHDIRRARLTDEGFCLETVGAGQGQSAAAVPDPYFDFVVSMPAQEHGTVWWLLRWTGCALLLACTALVVLLLLSALVSRFLPRISWRLVVAAAFLPPIAGMLSIVFFSPPDIHPDEKVHVAAGVYYMDHWLPPAIGDPAIDHTYSAYGMSRLDSFSSTYLAAGRFMALLQRLTSLDNHTAARLSALSCFVLLALLAWKISWQRSVVWVALVTPQVWYMFSYLNDDLLPFFYSMVLAGLCHRWFARPMGFTWKTAGLAGMLIGLLALEKANYLVFLCYMFMGSGLEMSVSKRFRKTDISRPDPIWLLVVILVACAVYGARLGVDRVVNGPDRNEKRLAFAEQRAKDGFKPSQYGDKDSYYGIHLKDKGLKFTEIFSKWKWHVITARSFFGFYGPMSIPSPGWYYTLVYCLAAGLLLYFMIKGLVGGPRDLLLTLATAGAVAGMVFVSAWHSWTTDFQAQGRYLFPLLGIVALFASRIWRRLYLPLVIVLCVALYSLSLYSFFAVGVAGLAGGL